MSPLRSSAAFAGSAMNLIRGRRDLLLLRHRQNANADAAVFHQLGGQRTKIVGPGNRLDDNGWLDPDLDVAGRNGLGDEAALDDLPRLI